MSKRIAYCADGTWDKASKQTNVYKLYKALLTTGDQIPLYDDGVGSDGNPIVMLLGGAFGTGLWEKIKEGSRRSRMCTNRETSSLYSALVAEPTQREVSRE